MSGKSDFKIRQELLDEVKKQELKLNSLEIQTAFEQESDREKKARFVQERRKYVTFRTKLENEILDNISGKLSSHAPVFEKALKELDAALKNVRNTVEILRTINLVTSIAAQIFKIP
jgi:anion-transporting  ArsA/GET3 family ATPase